MRRPLPLGAALVLLALVAARATAGSSGRRTAELARSAFTVVRR